MMKLKDILDPLKELLNDAELAEQLVDSQDSLFARRVYVRSDFAYYEGTIWLVKQACLKASSSTGVRKFEVAEYAILREECYKLKNNGKYETGKILLRLPENLRFTIDLFNKRFDAEIDLGVGSAMWEKFLDTLKIRHRITHPKSLNDYKITDDEFALCREVTGWFNDIVYETINRIVEVSEKMRLK
jgi:hypothetical protein